MATRIRSCREHWAATGKLNHSTIPYLRPALIHRVASQKPCRHVKQPFSHFSHTQVLRSMPHHYYLASSHPKTLPTSSFLIGYPAPNFLPSILLLPAHSSHSNRHQTPSSTTAEQAVLACVAVLLPHAWPVDIVYILCVRGANLQISGILSRKTHCHSFRRA